MLGVPSLYFFKRPWFKSRMTQSPWSVMIDVDIEDAIDQYELKFRVLTISPLPAAAPELRYSRRNTAKREIGKAFASRCS